FAAAGNAADRMSVGPSLTTVTLTAEKNEETAEKSIALIDYKTHCCEPLQRFTPICEKHTETHEDVTFAKVDTEHQQQLAMRYRVTSIPTLVAYREGIPVFSQAGALPQSALEDLIGQVKNLDMDEVRNAYAEAQDQQDEKA